MGIFIHLAISKSVTKEEWAKVYSETLQLVDNFPLAERRKVNVKGIETICLVPTKEREFIYGWNDEKVQVGWETVGDYTYLMSTAEDYFLPEDLVEKKEIDPEAGDAIYCMLPDYMLHKGKDQRFKHTYNLWGGKTQGEPYHMFLLSIACLIEDRLKEKAFIYGDITGGQCKKAVRMANEYLENKIEIPARCDMDRLFARVSKLELSNSEKLEVFETFYLGNQDEVFGEFITSHFSNEAQDIYWRKEFENTYVGSGGFTSTFEKYLGWGGNLKKLCDYVNCIDKEKNDLHEKFIICVMDAKLHLKEKDCRDTLKIDQNEERPYGIATLFAQFALAGAGNKKIDRYVPLEEIRTILVEAFHEKCDVNHIIDEYLAEEKRQQEHSIANKNASIEDFEKACATDASSVLNKIMDQSRQILQEEQEKYDINDDADFIYYEKGDTISPRYLDVLRDYFQFYQSTIAEERFVELMDKSAKERCEWIVEQNRSMLIRDIDWEKIFTDIEEHRESFERYYPMVRVALNSEGVSNLVKAIVLNDDFYEYCKNFSDK